MDSDTTMAATIATKGQEVATAERAMRYAVQEIKFDKLPEPVCRICSHIGKVDPEDDDRIVTRLELVMSTIGPVPLISWELVCNDHYRGGPFFWLSPGELPKKKKCKR